jgi:hypothetical protein
MTISDYFNRHKDEVAVVIGNGPSLRDIPLHFLTEYPTFGSNRVYLHFVPSYLVCVNPLVLEQFSREIQPLPCEKFIPYGWGIDGHYLTSSRRREFSYRPDQWVYEGYTVTFVSLQLAFWMGFKTVLLVGVDHRYAYDGKPNKETVMTGDDPNHFDPEYFKGARWNNPDLFMSEQAYGLAEIAYRQHGRKVINLTAGSDLNVFEKQELEAWL